MLCDGLKVWDEDEEGGRSKREKMYVHMADSVHCAEETNTTL